MENEICERRKDGRDSPPSAPTFRTPPDLGQALFGSQGSGIESTTFRTPAGAAQAFGLLGSSDREEEPKLPNVASVYPASLEEHPLLREAALWRAAQYDAGIGEDQIEIQRWLASMAARMEGLGVPPSVQQESGDTGSEVSDDTAGLVEILHGLLKVVEKQGEYIKKQADRMRNLCEYQAWKAEEQYKKTHGVRYRAPGT